MYIQEKKHRTGRGGDETPRFQERRRTEGVWVLQLSSISLHGDSFLAIPQL